MGCEVWLEDLRCEVWLEDLRDTAAFKGVELREDKYHYHTYFMRGYSVESVLSDLAEKQIARSREMKWISVEDALPEQKGVEELIPVMGWFVGDSLPKGEPCFCVYGSEDGFTDEEGSLNEYITHWMPLPNAPEEAE